MQGNGPQSTRNWWSAVQAGRSRRDKKYAVMAEIPKILNAPTEQLIAAEAVRLLKVVKRRRTILAGEERT